MSHAYPETCFVWINRSPICLVPRSQRRIEMTLLAGTCLGSHLHSCSAPTEWADRCLSISLMSVEAGQQTVRRPRVELAHQTRKKKTKKKLEPSVVTPSNCQIAKVPKCQGACKLAYLRSRLDKRELKELVLVILYKFENRQHETPGLRPVSD